MKRTATTTLYKISETLDHIFYSFGDPDTSSWEICKVCKTSYNPRVANTGIITMEQCLLWV